MATDNHPDKTASCAAPAAPVRNIWALSAVSLLTDVHSGTILALPKSLRGLSSVRCISGEKEDW